VQARLEMRVLTLSAVSLIALFHCACNLDERQNDPEWFPDGKAMVSWGTPSADGYGNATYAAGTVVDEILYQPLSLSASLGNGLAAMDLQNGVIVWQRDVDNQPSTNAATSNEYLYMLDNVGTWTLGFGLENRDFMALFRISKDGSAVRTLSLGVGNGGILARSSAMVPLKNGLLWPTYGYTGEIDGEKAGGLVYAPDIDCVPNEDGALVPVRFYWISDFLVYGNIVFSDNFVIFTGMNRKGINYLPGIDEPDRYRTFALDMDTGQEVWSVRPDVGFGAIGPGSMQIYKDRVYMFGFGAACLDAKTGSVIWINRHIGGDQNGALFEGNRLYCTAIGNPAIIKEDGDFVVCCADAYTGTIIWGDDLTWTEMGTNPQKYGNKLFVPASKALLVYEANTGERLYKDESVRGAVFQWNRSFRYGDTMIIISDDRVIAVDMSKS
jgi:outer membrane protein assembly factor BamB